MPIWSDDADGTGEYEIGKVFADDADGTGEYEIGKIWANDQDGSGEYLLFEANQWIDSFEDGDISEYWNETGDFTTTSAVTAAHGEYVLTNATTGSRKEIWSFEGDGLDNYIDQGDSFRFYWASSSTANAARPGIGYAHSSSMSQPTDGGYMAAAYPDQGKFKLYDWGSNSTLISLDISGYAANEWWIADVTWATDDTHTVDLYDSSGSFVTGDSVVDSTFSGNNGTVSWWQYCVSGEDCYMDAAEIL